MNSTFVESGTRIQQELQGPRLSTARKLPIELTPLIAVGAIMEPLAIRSDWASSANQIYGDCSKLELPSREQIRSSLWMTQEVMNGARDSMSYECHDLRVVKVDEKGRLHVLVGLRVEPNPDPSGIETAPINGFWWSIGGRRQIPMQDSPLDGKFDLVHSVLLKAHTEAGIEPSSVKGLFDLGIGRTEFPPTMTYVSKRETETGEVEESSREVQMKFAQRTINRNIVVMVDSDAVLADHTVDRLEFLSAEQYSDPATRAKFCDYEQAFLDALFEGWALTRTKNLL